MVFSSNELDLLILQHGKDGIPKDSKYIWVKYSMYPDGKELTDNPTGALYIGFSYNQESSVESENPADYTWIKIKGENGADAYTIVLSNENVSFAVEYETNKALDNQEFQCQITVLKGLEEQDNFAIGELSSENGITISKYEHTVTLSVQKDTVITGTNGSFPIPIAIDGLIFVKYITWSVSMQGATGQHGEPTLNVYVGNETQNIPCDPDGMVLENILIEIPFVGYVGYNRVDCTASVGLLPSGITLGTNEPSTAETDGLIILNVAKDSLLGNTNSGNVTITFTLEDNTLVKNFTWVKTKNGDNGVVRLYTLESSVPVLNKSYDGTLTPEKITFRAYYKDTDDYESNDFAGTFIVEESSDGTQFDNTYLSDQPEITLVYTPTTNDILSIRCSLYEPGSVTKLLDQQTVVVLADVDNLRPIISEIQESVSEVSSKVDAVEKSIENKVWQSDITTAINNYDGTTVKELRDRVSSQEITIDGITNTVKDVQTEVEKKADGSTVHTLSENLSKLEQDAEGFKQTVESTYATKDSVDSISSTLEQTASAINTKIEDLEGNISSTNQTVSSIQTQVENNTGDISTLKQTANSLQSQITDNANNISTLEQTATEIKTEVSEKQSIWPSSIRYIRDWLNGNDKDSENYFVECRIFANGENIAAGITAIAKDESLKDLSPQPSNISVYTDDQIMSYTDSSQIDTNSYVSTGTGRQCMQIDLGEARKDLDYIQIIHYYADNRFYNHQLEVSEDGEKWTKLYDSSIAGGYEETQDGRIYYISDEYINHRMSQITQDIDSINMVVQDNSDGIADLQLQSDRFQTTISQAQEDADAANASIGELNDVIAENQSTILQQINQIKMSVTEVRDDIGEIAASTFEQTADEFRFLFASIGMGNEYGYDNVNSNVIMSREGLTVVNPTTGVKTIVSPSAFAGYYQDQIVFQLNKDLVYTSRLHVDNGADFTTIKYIPKTYTSKSGKKIGALVHIKSGGSS